MRDLFAKRLFVGVATIVLAIGHVNVSAAANLVANGSFENYTGGDGSGNPSQLANPSYNGGGYTNLTDWTVNSGTYGFLMGPGAADTTGSYSPQFSNTFWLWGPGSGGGSVANGLTASSTDGGNYLALDGASGYRGGGISQTIDGLTAGNKYDVSFYWAGAQQYTYDGTTTEQVQVSLGTDSQSTSVWNNPSHGFSGWSQQTFTFTASSASEVLNFLAIGTPDGVPPFVLLDGVSLNAETPPSAVPEPSSLALSALGLIGLVVIRARRRAKSTVA